MREPGRRSRSRRLPSLISPFSRAPHPRWLWHRHVRQCARRHPPIEGAMTVKTKKIIMVELVETNVFSRWHCTVCDGCTNPVSVLAEGKDGKRAIRVCEQCLEAAEIDKRLAATAAAHERHAAYLRSLVGRLRVPTYAAWKARSQQCARWSPDGQHRYRPCPKCKGTGENSFQWTGTLSQFEVLWDCLRRSPDSIRRRR